MKNRCERCGAVDGELVVRHKLAAPVRIMLSTVNVGGRNNVLLCRRCRSRYRVKQQAREHELQKALAADQKAG